MWNGVFRVVITHAVLQTILLPLRHAKPESSPLGHRMLLPLVATFTEVHVEHTVPRWASVDPKLLRIHRITTSLGHEGSLDEEGPINAFEGQEF